MFVVDILGVWPPPRMPVTTRICPCLVGDSNLNLTCHCFLEGGHSPKYTISMDPMKFHGKKFAMFATRHPAETHQLRLVVYPIIYHGFYTSKRWFSRRISVPSTGHLRRPRRILMMVRPSRLHGVTKLFRRKRGVIREGAKAGGFWSLPVFFLKHMFLLLFLKETCLLSLNIWVIGSDLELPPGFKAHPSGSVNTPIN